MKLIVYGEPISKKRHRCACIQGKPRAFDPQVKPMEIIKQSLQADLDAQMKNDLTLGTSEIVRKALCLPTTQSFIVQLVFVFKTSDRQALPHCRAKLWHFQLHIQKPDLDNLTKLYLDCLTGVVWRDDCQVTQLSARKTFGITPRTEITIMPDNGIKVTKSAERALKCFKPAEIDKLFAFVQHLTHTGSYATGCFESATNFDGEQMQEIGNFLWDMGRTFGEQFKKIHKMAANE